MKTLLFIFLLFGQVTFGQIPMPAFTSEKKDTTSFLQFLPVKADYILAYSEESYWWSNTEDFNLLVRTGNTWMTWTYYRKWKSSSDVYAKNGKRQKYFKKQAVVDSSSVKELFDSLALIKFWTLSADTLNEPKGRDISDDVNYKFQIENLTGRQILESYAPEYYIDKFPEMQQRAIFVQGKEIFRRGWKRNAANNSFAKVRLTN